jgi:ubiquinone/menaquinone biosynthesis C-methylase UbiE
MRLDLVARAQTFISQVLGPGDLALDATLGKGYDTLFLARTVGETGRVYGLDIQAKALETTRERLEHAGLANRVVLARADHGRLAGRLPPVPDEGIQAAMINLGYLPGSDKRVITRPDSTLKALAGLAVRLRPGGRLSVLAYTGHPGGLEEAEAVETWARALAPSDWHLHLVVPEGTRLSPPRLLVISRKRDDGETRVPTKRLRTARPRARAKNARLPY